MYALLRQPRWLVLATIVGLITLLFANLGLWQLRRLEERRFDNTIQAERRGAEPVELDIAVTLDDGLTEAGNAHQGRPLRVSGVFDPSEEILLRSRTLDGEAGFHVVTPLIVDDGAAVLVNRGWVPLSLDRVPLTGPGAAPEGSATITGYGQASAVQPRFGPSDPSGDIDIFVRVDIDRMRAQVPYDLYPIVVVSQLSTDVPVPVAQEPLDEGPHLAYAIQWFAFAVISVVGFGALLRSTAQKAATRRARAADREDNTAPASA